ncbi:MAG: hypothetical protein Q8N18_01240 [Opitutaceae bacterium]|nr:hypothetical protein [Opitutaceae bacterium]
MKNSFTKLLGVLAFASSALVSQAVPFANGSFISMSSDNSVWTGGGGTSVADYTSVTSFGAVKVDARGGSFTTVAAGSAVTMGTPLVFANPFANNPLWSVGGFTFALNSFNAPVRNTGGALQTLVLSGSGLVSGNGFDGVGDWTWSGDAQGSATFTFSSSTVVRAPDGGLTIAFLGAAMIALAGLRRKFVS